MFVNILGTDYEIIVKKYDEDEAFKRNSFDGYCDGYAKKIVCCDMSTFEGWENEPEETVREAQKLTLRHEIVHAFLNESGLRDNACQVQSSWAKNEELVDWLAIQGIKLYKAWSEAKAL